MKDMLNTNSSPLTTIRASGNGANSGGETMSVRGASPATTTSYQEQQCPTAAAVMYPVASSGRGFLPTNHPCHSLPPYPHAHPLHFPNPSPRPPPPSLPHPSPSLYTKVAQSQSPSLSEANGHKAIRDRVKDESLVTVRDRKVKITDGATLYALCRSWLRNGFPDETQPQYGDAIKSLPHPLPMPVIENFPMDMEDKEEQKEEDKTDEEHSVENLSAQDLLKGHIARAKKIRSRLREERLKRIARYKTRLALLLPPLVEQFRNDAAAGN